MAEEEWDEIEVDWQASVVRNITRDNTIAFEPLSDADREMLVAGGVIGYLHARD